MESGFSEPPVMLEDSRSARTTFNPQPEDPGKLVFTLTDLTDGQFQDMDSVKYSPEILQETVKEIDIPIV